MAVRLVPVEDGPPINLDRPIVFVGRHADCDVRIDSKKYLVAIVALFNSKIASNPRPGQYETESIVMGTGSRRRISPSRRSTDCEHRYKVVVNDSISGSPVTGGTIPPGLTLNRGVALATTMYAGLTSMHRRLEACTSTSCPRNARERWRQPAELTDFPTEFQKLSGLHAGLGGLTPPLASTALMWQKCWDVLDRCSIHRYSQMRRWFTSS